MRMLIWNVSVLPVLFALLMAITSGCATTEARTDKTPATADDDPPTVVTPEADGPIRAEVAPIDGTALTTLEPSTATIVYVEGSRKGTQAKLVTASTQGDTWTQTVEGIRAMTLKVVDGQVLLLREEDVGENVAIAYTPPFVLMPSKVAAGHKHEGLAQMKIDNLATGDRRDSGPCVYTVELLGMQKIVTPAGTFDAYLFRTVRDMNLSLAKVKVIIHTAHVPQRGLIMTRVERHTRALGLISLSKTEEWRLAK